MFQKIIDRLIRCAKKYDRQKQKMNMAKRDTHMAL